MLRDVAGGGNINSQKSVLTFSGIIVFKIEIQTIEQNINEGINEGINSLYLHIKHNPNQRVSQIEKTLNVPSKTLERWIKQLKDEGKIVYQGSKKTGGYFAN